jgi:glycosyltransferase involved in cell wall biosynthesis
MCLPTLNESFGLVVLEAMASGRPVVVTKTVGPSELVGDGKNGFIVSTADSDAIADAIIKIFSDYELSSKMGVEGRRLVEEKYDWSVIAKRYFEIYSELLL